MTESRTLRIGVAVVLIAVLLGGVVVASGSLLESTRRTHLVAYFDNSNGLYAGDEVRILGVRVGEVERIEPLPDGAKISFWVSDKYPVPADAKAVIVAPQLVTARAIQLTPVYRGGPRLENNAEIPKSRTAVPVEWDELREQLEKLTDAMQPTEPGGLSTLGAFVQTSAANLRGEGLDMREAIIAMSEAFSALGDHSDDLFTTVKNLSVLVSALTSSRNLLANLNQNFAATIALLANDPAEISRAVEDLNTAVDDVAGFVAEQRETLGTTVDKLASVTTAVVESMPDIKQSLHAAPNSAANLSNAYQAAQSTLTGALTANNFSNPLDFICSAVQAASRLGAEQAAKLCVQYLAPILKNRRYNFPPFGINPFVGATARPNEVTYSEDRLRPGHAPPPEAAPVNAMAAQAESLAAEGTEHLPADRTVTTVDPAAGLRGLLVPQEGGR